MGIYSKWIVSQLKEECKLVNEQYHGTIETNIDNNTVANITHRLVFPYKGEKGENLMKSLNKHIKSSLTTCLQ